MSGDRQVLLVTGSRSAGHAHKRLIWDTILDYVRKGWIVMHGGADGVDTMASQCVGHVGGIEMIFHPEWREHGRRAGILRNQLMLDQQPDKVIAFWDGASRGTKHMIDIASKAGYEVEVFRL